MLSWIKVTIFQSHKNLLFYSHDTTQYEACEKLDFSQITLDFVSKPLKLCFHQFQK